MNKKNIFLKSCLSFLATTQLMAVEPKIEPQRPNFLWVVVEDSSPYQWGVYGNKLAPTPTLEQLAKEGVLFTNAYSCGPQCSPARSTLISGVMATTYGMDYHSGEVPTPTDIFYPGFFKKAGYFTTNNKKTHYNTANFNFATEWTEQGRYATYASKDRDVNQPFFSVFNNAVTHTHRMRSMTIEGRRDLSKIGIDVDKVTLPPYVPNLPETRADQAMIYETITIADKWVKSFVDDLKAKGLYDDTIIFFYSDHGGAMGRAKGYPFETSYKIPLIIKVPPKWQDEFNMHAGTIDDRFISFEDFAPTVLSMAGIEIPKHMTGVAQFGKYAAKEKKKYQFAFRTNQGVYDPVRTVTDGEWKYIRNYFPQQPFRLRNFAQWGIPSNLAWDEYVLSGNCKDPLILANYQGKPSEMLFNLKNDPWEIENLADDPQCQAKLIEFRKLVSDNIRATKDLGFFPRGLRDQKPTLYDYVRATNYPLDELYDAVELASMATTEEIPKLIEILKSPYPAIQYWGIIAFSILGSREEYNQAPAELKALLNSEYPDIQVTAAAATIYLGDNSGLEILVNNALKGRKIALAEIESMSWYPRLNKLFLPYVDSFLNSPKYSVEMRSILINLKAIKVEDLYTEEERLAAREVNDKVLDIDFDKLLKSIETDNHAGKKDNSKIKK